MDGVPVRNDSEMLTWGVGTLIESSQVEVPFQVYFNQQVLTDFWE